MQLFFVTNPGFTLNKQGDVIFRRRFAAASAYARATKADPQVWAKYQRRAKMLKKRPRDLAISDFYKGKDLLK